MSIAKPSVPSLDHASSGIKSVLPLAGSFNTLIPTHEYVVSLGRRRRAGAALTRLKRVRAWIPGF